MMQNCQACPDTSHRPAIAGFDHILPIMKYVLRARGGSTTWNPAAEFDTINPPSFSADSFLVDGSGYRE